MQDEKMSFMKRTSFNSVDGTGTLRKRFRNINMWRSNSLISLSSSRKSSDSVLESIPYPDDLDCDIADNALALVNRDSVIQSTSNTIVKSTKRVWSTVVNVVLVEARGLPDPPDDGSPHSLYCKIRLGSEKLKSKTVENTIQPEWRERFKLHLYNDHVLRISLWEKKKINLRNIAKAQQKNFMGSCVLDLSQLEKERTHEIWQDLYDGYGSVHVSITMCTIRNSNTIVAPRDIDTSVKELQRQYECYNFGTDWNIAGQVHVKVIAARGLNTKLNAYCTVELDNQRVETQSIRASHEPVWNKSYVFNIYDVTSTLDFKVHDSALMPSMRECLGRVSVPLLRVRNDEVRWYALKDKSRRNIAKGNCPRILLEINVFYNPFKAALKLFKPKDVKHIKKSPKFDIALMYRNVEFVRDTFDLLVQINESYKSLLEWDNKELCYIALPMWLLFWYHFELWAAPLLLLLPFIYFRLCDLGQKEKSFMRGYSSMDDSDQGEVSLNYKSLTERIQDVPDMTLTITNGIEFIASLAEKFYNLASFKVPFLSYCTMVLLVIASIVLYKVPFKYLLMALGIYKYARKHLNPQRVLNNDFLDFISRIPDTETLKDWKELSVPEPQQSHSVAKYQTAVREL